MSVWRKLGDNSLFGMLILRGVEGSVVGPAMAGGIAMA